MSWEFRFMARTEVKGRDSLGPQGRKNSEAHVVGFLRKEGVWWTLYPFFLRPKKKKKKDV